MDTIYYGPIASINLQNYYPKLHLMNQILSMHELSHEMCWNNHKGEILLPQTFTATNIRMFYEPHDVGY
jgi:hypothetical protein